MSLSKQQKKVESQNLRKEQAENTETYQQNEQPSTENVDKLFHQRMLPIILSLSAQQRSNFIRHMFGIALLFVLLVFVPPSINGPNDKISLVNCIVFFFFTVYFSCKLVKDCNFCLNCGRRLDSLIENILFKTAQEQLVWTFFITLHILSCFLYSVYVYSTSNDSLSTFIFSSISVIGNFGMQHGATIKSFFKAIKQAFDLCFKPVRSQRKSRRKSRVSTKVFKFKHKKFLFVHFG